MKSSYILYSALLMCLPLLCVLMVWDSLPDRLPVHFGDNGQPDRFASRQAWLVIFLTVMFPLLLIRSVIVVLLSKRFSSQDKRFVRIYLLSATFVGSILGLFVLQTIYKSPVYTDYLPVLMALIGAGGVYFTGPTALPAADKIDIPVLSPRETAILLYLNTLSRLVMVRVNLLAALLMLFARSSDRWTIGIWANLLAFIALLITAGVYSRQSN